MKLTFHYLAIHLSFLLLADAKSLRTLPTTSDSDESRNLEDTPCFKKVVQYGTYPVTFQNDVEGRIGKVNYLAESADPATTTVYTYESPDEWVLLSQVPNGWTDPKYGECVKFGDKAVISNAKVVRPDGLNILTAGTYNSYLSDGNENMPFGGVSASQFIIRSTPGNGDKEIPDLKQGRCVEDGDKIFLQANNMDSRWVNGSRRDGTRVTNRNLFGESPYGIDYELTQAYQNYVWIVRVDDSVQVGSSCKAFSHNGTPDIYNLNTKTGAGNYSAIDGSGQTLADYCKLNNCCSKGHKDTAACSSWSSNPAVIYEVCEDSCNGYKACQGMAWHSSAGSSIKIGKGSCSTNIACQGFEQSNTGVVSLYIAPDKCNTETAICRNFSVSNME